MQQHIKKSVLGLVLAGLLSSSMGLHPAEARSRHSRGLVIGIGVVALVALIAGHHKHKSSSGVVTTTTTAPAGTGTVGTAPTAATP